VAAVQILDRVESLSWLRSLLTVYHTFTAHALWPLPIYCWLLLVSGWARRATFLWAALPLVAIGGVELIVFRTRHFAGLVGSRLIGAALAFGFPGQYVPIETDDAYGGGNIS
jgi:ABC-2 type transport system permease protein